MDEIVGQLNYAGDIRAGISPQVMYSPRHGAILPASVEYDEETDRTSVGFVTMDVGRSIIQAEDAGPSLAEELQRRKREKDAAWARAAMGGSL